MDILRKIDDEEMLYGNELQPPASISQIETFKADFFEFCQKEVPVAYSNLLELHNGLIWNGLNIYATETLSYANHKDIRILGFIEANKGYRIDDQRFKSYLVFADSDISYYVYSMPENEYQVLDNVSLDRFEVYKAFDEFLEYMLERHL